MKRLHVLPGLCLALLACEAEEQPPSVPDAQPVDAFVPARDFQVFEAGTECERSEEVCDGIDNDCDGKIDADDEDLQRALFVDPLNCGACGTVCEAPNAELGCQAGECVLLACAPGFRDYNADLSDGCEGDCVVTAGGQELCDETDNDCDGLVDEDVDLETDMGNCGACGEVCGHAPHGRNECVGGVCVLAECESGHVNLDGDDANGCEYACEPRSTEQIREYCNALDDDCDGLVDELEDLVVPADDCGEVGECGVDCAEDGDCPEAERCNGGVCVPADGVAPDSPCETDADCHAVHPGYACLALVTLVDLEPVTTRRCVERIHAPMCDGADGFRCTRAPTWRFGDEQGRCDQLDNDCDGRVDEDFVEGLYELDRRTPRVCRVGLGVCERSGVAQCAADGGGVECSAAPPEPPAPDDAACDGRDDDCDGVVDEDFEDAWVSLGDFEIYAYEASRPGATAELPGLDPVPDDEVVVYVEGRPCSRPEVLPWVDLTWAEAQAACAAVGARLCTDAEWTRACAGEGAEAFPYGADYIAGTCNGGGYDADPEVDGDQDALLVCGAAASCERDGVFDLSGNAKEWTDDRIDGLRPIRGGGFESNLPGGLSCGQRGDLKGEEFHHQSIGFRCCR